MQFERWDSCSRRRTVWASLNSPLVRGVDSDSLRFCGGIGRRGVSSVIPWLILNNPILDGQKHTLQILFDLSILITNHVESESLKVSLSCSIIFQSLIVSRPVNFNYELESTAEKINNILADWLLAVEVETEHSSPLELFPEQDLCQC